MLIFLVCYQPLLSQRTNNTDRRWVAIGRAEYTKQVLRQVKPEEVDGFDVIEDDADDETDTSSSMIREIMRSNEDWSAIAPLTGEKVHEYLEVNFYHLRSTVPMTGTELGK